MRTIELMVNGTRETLQIEDQALLLDVLRDKLFLTGTKEGCSVGACGTCTVLIDGLAVNSCLVPVCQADGTEIVTVEGLADGDRL
ncbi:MAG: 2Fe-2S iron-sulfur cluster-binding protein, partial [Nitrospinota bacterium]|nr:2Fe-2S iron-sulfur cluster-binding protein [Nitrospinota bacterium]